jgi:hypothetical protein
MGTQMSEENVDQGRKDDKEPERGEAESPQPRRKRRKAAEERVYLVPYPKVVFFYPTLLTAAVLAVWMTVTDRFSIDADDRTAVVMTWIFLGVFSINLAIITFDFPRATSLTMFFFLAAVVLGGYLLFMFYPDLFPAATALVAKIRPAANATFFIVFSAVLVLIYLTVFVAVRFNYWEVRPNELLHHHGILSDLKRYSAPNLRVDKEINDVFEYLLLRSGRLILQPSSERRAVILENVPFIGHKEEAITAMLGALQVKMRSDDE